MLFSALILFFYLTNQTSEQNKDIIDFHRFGLRNDFFLIYSGKGDI